jgi:hypothetical protein
MPWIFIPHINPQKKENRWWKAKGAMFGDYHAAPTEPNAEKNTLCYKHGAPKGADYEAVYCKL